MTAAVFGVEESGTVLRGAGTKAVTVYRAMAFGGILVHSLDHLVLTHLLFAIADGEPVTPQIVWKRLQSLGIRSAKSDDILVGRTSVYESFARIIAAGYIHRVQLPNPKGGGLKGPVVYLAYEDPADNPDRGTGTTSPQTLARAQAQLAALALTKVQVTPRSGYREAVQADSATNDVSAGQTAFRLSGSGATAFRQPERGGKGVPAGQTAYRVPERGELAPPHTPPEVKTLPSFPHTTTVPPVAAEAGPGGGVRSAKNTKPSRAEVAALKYAAVEFLRSLPGPWECGITVARRLSKLLVDVHVDQGWPLGPELVEAVTEEKPGARPIDSYPNMLKYRLGALPRYRPAPGSRNTSQSEAAPVEPCEYHPQREASSCSICSAGRDYAAEQPPVEQADQAAPEAEHDVTGTDGEHDSPVPPEIRKLFTQTAKAVIPTSRDGRKRQRTGRAAGLQKKLAADAERAAADRAGMLARLEELMQAGG